MRKILPVTGNSKTPLPTSNKGAMHAQVAENQVSINTIAPAACIQVSSRKLGKQIE
jgi:hypothetical protein